MYRGRMSLDGIAKCIQKMIIKPCIRTWYELKRFDTGSCSESYEIFGGQLDFDFGRKLHDAMLSVR